MNCVWEVFGACKSLKSIAQLHCQLIKAGLIQDAGFASSLTDAYISLELSDNALKLIDEIPHRSAYAWNCILQRCCREKRYADALSIFSRLFSCQNTDSLTLCSGLKACSELNAIGSGQTIHSFITKLGLLNSNLFIGTRLVELYSKCGIMDDALRVFKEYHKPDIVLRTSLISGYEQNGEPKGSLTVFAELIRCNSVGPDDVTLISAVSACTQLFDMNAGRSIHGFTIRRKRCFDLSLPLVNSFLNLYAKTGGLMAAENLFSITEQKDVISWGTMLSCYAHNGAAKQAVDLFNLMIHRGCVEPNSVSFITTLQACEATGNILEGRKIHKLVVQKGFDSSDIFLSTALIDMYMNCGCPSEAITVFERMSKKDAVAWSSVLHGCVHNKMAHESMTIFHDMLTLGGGIKPDSSAMVSVLTACSELGNLQQACCLHGHITKHGFKNDKFVGASLIESHAKCGGLGDAIGIFEEIKEDKDVVIWSSMLAAYGMHGKAKESISLFSQMMTQSSTAVRPNEVTFLSILAVCSHTGLVKEGIEFFKRMVHDYTLMPESKHYSALVDLLGRNGELDESISSSIIDGMKSQGLRGDATWGALLRASRMYQNGEMGRIAAKNLFQLDPNNMGYHLLLSNIYAVDGDWDGASELRASITKRGLHKMAGESVVFLN
ncbi:unnamed protein product [Cuscuta epithymum]|uniref:Pentatricopeptide repeat-containing protein n=1 Tax=Cuscuta epithymum TaxID=186058 RepID=A0AAV0CFY9_9ASTE|nr:unnamed protein product [Cuscuta epithymum]